MKEIISHYGRTVLVVASVMAVFGLLFFQNSPMKLSSVSKEGVERSMLETKKVHSSDKVESNGRPNVKARGGLCIGEEYEAADLIEGEGVEFAKIVSISNCVDLEDERIINGKVKFSKPGIYRLSIYVEDSEERHGTQEFYLGVNE